MHLSFFRGFTLIQEISLICFDFINKCDFLWQAVFERQPLISITLFAPRRRDEYFTQDWLIVGTCDIARQTRRAVFTVVSL